MIIRTLTGRDPTTIPNGSPPPANGSEVGEQAFQRGDLQRLSEGGSVEVSDVLKDRFNKLRDSEEERAVDASEASVNAYLEYVDQVEREARFRIWCVVRELDYLDDGRGYEHVVRLLRELREMQHGPSKRRELARETRFAVYCRDGFQCVECGEHEIHQLSIDHRVPVILGGTNEPDNLRTLCRPCNSAKGGRL